MKSLERKFNEIRERNKNFSTYICFTKAIEGKKFNKRITYYWFKKLVDKDDYVGSEKMSILRHLDYLSNHLRNVDSEV
jgi:hypothetical protein